MKIDKKLLKPADNYSWSGNTGESIILHTTWGSTTNGAISELKRRQLSYHFIIGHKGEVIQLVDTKRSAWHAGVKHKPNLRVREFFGEENPNRKSVGIAIVGYGSATVEQIAAAAQLIKHIGQQTGVRYNTNNIFYHQEITSYKPDIQQVTNEVVRELIGFKDDKDDVQKHSQMKLLIKILGQYVALLTKKLKSKV